MMIAIDGYEANVPERVGIGRYAFEILKHMYEYFKTQNSKLKTQSETRFRIYLPSPPLSDMPREIFWWRYRVLSPRELWTLFRLPIALATDRPAADIMFSPTHYVPRFTNIPRVMSIMDVSYLHYPNLFRPQDLYQLTQWTRYAALHAARILTISEFSRGAIIKAYGAPPERVVVTYPGLTMPNAKLPMLNIQNKYNIGKYYILSVGTLQPRKNYVRLIEAFSRFLALHKPKLGSIDLVIVGKKGWLYEDILAAPARFGVGDHVKFLDFVPDEDLSALYEHALCFALTSLYEGFGLPVLESMAMGCPVVVSQVSSLPEIAGEAGIYVDPMRVESIVNGIHAAIGERDTKQGKKRIAKGLSLAKNFTWEKAASETLKILMEVGRLKS